MFFEKPPSLSDQRSPNTVNVLGYWLDNSKLNGIGNVRIAPLKWVAVLLFVIAISFPSIFSEVLDLRLSSDRSSDSEKEMALAPEAKAGAAEDSSKGKKISLADIWPDEPKPEISSETRPVEVDNIGTQPAAQSWEDNGKVGLPRRLIIPSINVDANVQELGAAKNGELETPSKFKDVGWYRFSSWPGSNGNAVIAGHLDTPSGGAAVFWNLYKLNVGEYIYVVDQYNNRRRFRVTEKNVYDEKNAPIDEIFGKNGSVSRLKLITCYGVWDRKAGTYNKRLVVSAEIAPE